MSKNNHKKMFLLNFRLVVWTNFYIPALKRPYITVKCSIFSFLSYINISETDIGKEKQLIIFTNFWHFKASNRVLKINSMHLTEKSGQTVKLPRCLLTHHFFRQPVSRRKNIVPKNVRNYIFWKKIILLI